jgi:hypothetical protein
MAFFIVTSEETSKFTSKILIASDGTIRHMKWQLAQNIADNIIYDSFLTTAIPCNMNYINECPQFLFGAKTAYF